MERRTFLRWIASAAAAWPVRGVQLQAQAIALPAESVATLHALAPIVLPGELGAAGHRQVVGEFVEWLAAYRAGVERGWGYGHPRRTETPPIDPREYATQLAAIEEQARAQGAESLRALAPEHARRLVSTTIETLDAHSLPGSPNGTHILLDLMAFYFSSGAAVDRVYRMRIARATCRGLMGAAARPSAIAGD